MSKKQPAISGGSDPSVTFDRSLGFFDATMIGVGAMIGAGIFVLTGIAAGEAGPASLLAFGLNGVVTLITAMAYAELASAIPEAGGGYSFVKKAFPDILAFVAGWWLWFAYTAACALYAAGFGSYFMEFLARYFPGTHGILISIAGEHAAVLAMVLLAGIAFIALNVRGAGVTGKIENVIVIAKIAVLAVFIIFGIEAIIDDVPAAKAEFTPFLPKGFSGVLIAMGLTFIAFEGYDLIATVAEEIKDPSKNIPRAIFVSVAVAVVIYLCVIVVSLGAVHPDESSAWEFLGKYQEMAIVKAAAQMMPGVGVFLIVLGGVLSTMSALNATILASSRVAFSMARDGWLPGKIAVIHKQRRTPHVAIAITGVIFLFTAVALPIDALGSAASVMFLLVFAMVNLALVALRRKQPNLKRAFRVPLYPLLPILGFGINFSLALFQFKFDYRPWAVVTGWTVTGLLFYFALFERKVKAQGPQVLELERPPETEDRDRYKIIVPLSNPDTVDQLINIAAAIAKPKNGEIIALSVVLVPEQLPIHEGIKLAHHRRSLIRSAQNTAQKLGIDLRGDLRIAHSLRDAIFGSVQTHKPDVTVMGWKGFTRKRDRIFGEITDYMIRHCPSDLAVLKLVSSETKRILLATSGGPNATLGAEFTRFIAEKNKASVDACVVVPTNAEKASEREALERISNSLEQLDLATDVGRHIVKANSIAAGIAKASRDFDLVVIGAAPTQPFKQIIAGDIPEKVARFSPRSVMLIRRWQGPVSGLFRKLFG
ncbi:MAG: amino acid permease [Proteobacteria bacterium]|nr:amino acid permease [Pseudomonadota bacterium]